MTCLAAGWFATARAAEPRLPAGFVREILAGPELPEPLDLQFAPDGALWVTTRPGRIWRLDTVTRARHLVGEMVVDWSDDRCLHGIAFDPGFVTNGAMYLFHHVAVATNEPARARVARFTVLGSGAAARLDLASSKTLLEFTVDREGHDHVGGGLLVHPGERTLYVSVGDNNRIADLKLYSRDPENRAQNLGDLRGKILRLNLDGSVPASNPYAGQAGRRGEIFTRGHRQPWQLSLDAASGLILCAENGGDWEENHDEINRVVPGANFGWPRVFGDNMEVLAPTNRLEGFTPAWFSYRRNTGASCTGALIYRRGAGDGGFPGRFEGGLFYSDFNRKSVRFAPVDPQTQRPGTSEAFLQNLTGGPVALRLGPDGALYLAEYGGWFAATTNDCVSRVVWRGRE
jgi:glucose/arabinose dehydrogenase